jgi:hypothetical protein
MLTATAVLADHLRGIWLGGAESRLAVTRPQTLLAMVAAAQTEHVPERANVAERVDHVGAIVNRGTQLLYTYGRARLALDIVEGLAEILRSIRDTPPATGLAIQLAINRIRLLRALGRVEALDDAIAQLNRDVADLDIAGVDGIDPATLSTSITTVSWLERYKCAWRSGDYARCLDLACHAPRSVLAEEGLLKAELELGDYRATKARAAASSSRYARAYAALASLRSGATDPPGVTVDGLADLTPLCQLRIAVERTECAGPDAFGKDLAVHASTAAQHDGDPATTCLAAVLTLAVYDEGDHHARVALDHALATDRHNVTQFVGMAALLPTRRRATAAAVCLRLLCALDVELVEGSAALQAYRSYGTADELSAHHRTVWVELCDRAAIETQEQATLVSRLCRQALNWL